MSFSSINGFDNVLHSSADALAKKIIESEDPDEAVKKINDIVNQVLNKSSYSAIELSEAKRLLSKIEAVNQKIVDSRHISPFKTAVQRLHDKFDDLALRSLPPPPLPPHAQPSKPSPAYLPPHAQPQPAPHTPPPGLPKSGPPGFPKSAPPGPAKPKHPGK